jgi:hypothetical protein
VASRAVPKGIRRSGRWLGRAARPATWQRSAGAIARRLGVARESSFEHLTASYDVVIMKHCFPASDVLADLGRPDPASPRQSLENYQAVYRLLRDRFDKSRDTRFIIWTLPPRHRLFEPAEGGRQENAARATEFSKWLTGEFLEENGPHPNIFIWDFRGLVMDVKSNFLKYEYESAHDSPNSHPNQLANNDTGPGFARFIVDAVNSFSGSNKPPTIRIVFLCHSTGRRVYEYTDLGVKAWFEKYTAASGKDYKIRQRWYPFQGNLPVHYYRSWVGH